MNKKIVIIGIFSVVSHGLSIASGNSASNKSACAVGMGRTAFIPGTAHTAHLSSRSPVDLPETQQIAAIAAGLRLSLVGGGSSSSLSHSASVGASASASLFAEQAASNRTSPAASPTRCGKLMDSKDKSAKATKALSPFVSPPASPHGKCVATPAQVRVTPPPSQSHSSYAFISPARNMLALQGGQFLGWGQVVPPKSSGSSSSILSSSSTAAVGQQYIGQVPLPLPSASAAAEAAVVPKTLGDGTNQWGSPEEAFLFTIRATTPAPEQASTLSVAHSPYYHPGVGSSADEVIYGG